MLAKTRNDGFTSVLFADKVEALKTLAAVKAVKFDPDDEEGAANAALDQADPTAFKFPLYRASKALLNRVRAARAPPIRALCCEEGGRGWANLHARPPCHTFYFLLPDCTF